MQQADASIKQGLFYGWWVSVFGLADCIAIAFKGAEKSRSHWQGVIPFFCVSRPGDCDQCSKRRSIFVVN
jgi:hypothetical protein